MCVAVWGFYTHSFTLHDTQLSCVFEKKKIVISSETMQIDGYGKFEFNEVIKHKRFTC